MGGYIGRRIAQGLIVIVAAITISFALANVLGNPVDVVAGYNLSPQQRAQLVHAYGYDKPIAERYVTYVSKVSHGDFGQSLRNDDPAAQVVLHALPYTAVLVLGAILTACAVAIPVAIHSVLRRESRLDRVLRRGLALVQGVPEFWLALLLVLLFSVTLHWLPSIGASGVQSLIMPVLALSLPLMSTIVRLVRSQLVDVLGMDFITALRAKGLTMREIVFHHAVRNSLAPFVTFLALQLGWLVGGTILVENVFSWPGIGSLMVSATQVRDLTVIEACVVLVATAYVVLNLLADLAIAAIDPRVRVAAR